MDPWTKLQEVDPDGDFVEALDRLDLDGLEFQIQIQDWVLLRKRTAHRFGCCRGHLKAIEIHPILWDVDHQVEAFREVLLHELVHAAEYILTGRIQGHGAFFVNLALEVGIPASAVCDRSDANVALQKSTLSRVKPVLKCTGCGAVIKRLKFYPKNRNWCCRRCGNPMVRP